jgi:hypothetical protein
MANPLIVWMPHHRVNVMSSIKEAVGEHASCIEAALAAGREVHFQEAAPSPHKVDGERLRRYLKAAKK